MQQIESDGQRALVELQRLADDTGLSVTQVARDNGLHPTLVSRWKREFKEAPEEAFQGPGHPYKVQAKLAEMERLVGRLYAENEFLRKTLEHVESRFREEKRKST